ncbi:hypothetical protein CsSME_00000960 [Camellia sinensis var. sinensis]
MFMGNSHAFRGYGNVMARGWYMELPEAVHRIVDQAGFGTFCMGLSRLTASRPLLAALVRWWDTTDSFHLSAMGDMTMTPFDFSMLTGIGVGGDPIPFDTDMDEWEAAQMYLLGDLPPLACPGFVRYSWFEDHFRIQAPTTREEEEQYTRGFLMFLLGTTLFTDRANTVPLCLLSALVDVTRIRGYDWGGAGLATLYGYMSSSSRLSGQLLRGYWRAWEIRLLLLFYISALHSMYSVYCTHCGLRHTGHILHPRHTYNLFYTLHTLHNTLHILHNLLPTDCTLHILRTRNLLYTDCILHGLYTLHNALLNAWFCTFYFILHSALSDKHTDICSVIL